MEEAEGEAKGEEIGAASRSGAPWGLCCLAIFLLVGAVIVVPNLLSLTKSPGGEAPQIGALRAISNAQALFSRSDADGDGSANFGTLKDLSEFDFIDPVLGAGEKQGYRYEVLLSKDGSTWCAKATSTGESPESWWYADAEGIWFSATPIALSIPWDGTRPAGLLTLLGQ